jgi:hypothetical protein
MDFLASQLNIAKNQATAHIAQPDSAGFCALPGPRPMKRILRALKRAADECGGRARAYIEGGERISSRQEISRYLTAVLSELLHDLLVQPPVHRPSVVHIARIVQFLGELLARGEAAVEVQ